MKYDCGVIEDLLPLYKDGICSEASKKMVEEHLEECEKCREMLKKYNDDSITEIMEEEKKDVIESRSRYFKRKSVIAGSIIAGVFAIPILICLIVNLAGGKGLSWFFIVLAAMFIPGSLFVVPLMVPKNRMFATMVSFTASIIFLLAVCCIYSGGSWFFVAASSVLFGLTMVFSPFIACRRPVRERLGIHKGLAVMSADTITYLLMIVCIGLSAGAPGFFRIAFSISIPVLMFIWILFLLIRYLPANGLVKAGACIAVISAAEILVNELIGFLMTMDMGPGDVVVYTQPSLALTALGIGIGGVMVLTGLLVGKKKNGGEK